MKKKKSVNKFNILFIITVIVAVILILLVLKYITDKGVFKTGMGYNIIERRNV